MNRFSGKKVAIVGLSTEGQDSVKFMLTQGAHVHCYDRRTEVELGNLYKQLAPQSVKFHLGNTYLEGIDRTDIIIRTPGMALDTLEFINASQKGVEITSLIKLFMELCPCPVIGVTGTKGKGTTTTLIGEILRASGHVTHIGGNVGVPLLSSISSIQKDHRVVLELSSFQLEDLTISPHIAVVLAVTQDHLANTDPNASNYHKTRQVYIQAKKNIVSHQKPTDMAVINYDDETAKTFAKETEGNVYYFSKTMSVSGAYVKNGYIVRAMGKTEEVIAKTTQLQLRGRHNWENITAAIVASSLAGATLEGLRAVVSTFKGLDHRLEFVGQYHGIKYYNDSFSTTPETAIAAIHSFEEPIILIAGGSEKGSDYTQLGEEIINSQVKAVILIGVTAPKIERAIRQARTVSSPMPKLLTGATTMEAILKQARANAAAGDIILLSPACASFGMFANYKERGTLFKHYAQT